MNKVDLSQYDNSWYHPDAGVLKRAIWYVINELIFRSAWFPLYRTKAALLRLFGAQVGKGVVIKPNVNIKYPWLLRIGDHSWIGEQVWIDNLAMVCLGNHVCLSQGAMLLCGNHDYSKPSFDLKIGEIEIEDGAWIGAKSIVCPGITIGTHAVLSVGSVATADLQPYGIYQGTPAQLKKQREVVS